ncbi:serine/threonine protein phosphatase [Paenibacillus baekrokdamisoli]|uniref:Serine/threonine protein phosphatase n=1 Tax=Paenibacillus baekrokdamisoli TaxID=1712516 RepID=A0A3G9IQA3_9BACL|nr:metallophosphoesterase [Paenibacillus baekrokdamisoli]BBH20433.1 serine/threonine protein phosphatase [Paenibacillus baekrokdamisoli]BBH20452.1 serine/threonine protein phosphatase [Paenibacillus baekrokdamisoli]
MRILVISDEESKYIWDHFEPKKFKDINIIISCGDLKAEYLSFLVSMINAPLFYVHGNHDTKYKSDPPEGCESIEDRIVTYNGIRILGLGGSYRYSPGEYQFSERQMSWRITKLKLRLWLSNGVDILVTHAPAYRIGDGDDLCHRGFECFIEFMNQYNPRYLLHGHQHLNYGRNQRIHHYKKTEIINAFGYHIIEI